MKTKTHTQIRRKAIFRMILIILIVIAILFLSYPAYHYYSGETKIYILALKPLVQLALELVIILRLAFIFYDCLILLRRSKKMEVLDVEAVQGLIGKANGTSIKSPLFFNERTDMAIIQKDQSYGYNSKHFTVWYLAYNNKENKIKILHNTGLTNENGKILSFKVLGRDIILKTSMGEFHEDLSRLGLPM